MAGFIKNCFGCMSNTAMAIIRVFLIIACTIMLLSQVLALWALYAVENEIMETYFPGFKIQFRAYLILIGLAALSLIGLHGACTKNPKYLKLFALIAAAYVLCSLLVDPDDSKEKWAKTRGQFADQMEEYAEEYQFDLKPGQTPNKATRAWDVIQKNFMCCGLDSPKDWPIKWSKVTNKDLPNSCCLAPLTRSTVRVSLFAEDALVESKARCRVADGFELGCLKRLDDVMAEAHSHKLIGLLFYCSLILCAITLAKHSELAIEAANSPNAPTTHYQRFDGSVYVREPSVQVSYDKQPAKFAGYPDAGLLYPNSQTINGDVPPKYEH